MAASSSRSSPNTFTATSAGSYTIRLTITDAIGRTASADTSITVASAPSSGGGGGGGATDLASLTGILALALFAANRRNRA